MKFWLKNFLSLWSWSLVVWDNQYVFCFLIYLNTAFILASVTKCNFGFFWQPPCSWTPWPPSSMWPWPGPPPSYPASFWWVINVIYISHDYVYITWLEFQEIHRGLSIFASQVSDSLSSLPGLIWFYWLD